MASVMSNLQAIFQQVPIELDRQPAVVAKAVSDIQSCHTALMGGRLGITMVLHTWSQNLSQHVHVHCLVTAGALTDEGIWKATPKGYLFPAKALRNWFRRGYLDGLKAMHGELRLGGALAHLKNDAAFNRWLTPLYQKTWSFHIKPPFAGPKHLIGYLGRYTHRTAISNQRIQSFDGRRVTFLWRDYRDGDQVKPMTLQVAEFTRRFLLHILPRGMARIRHYGLNTNRARQDARRALRAPEPEPPIPETLGEWFLRIVGHCIDRCPRCKIGRLKIVKTIHQRARDPPRLFSQLK